MTSVAFSPDGERIVSGSWDKTIYVWDALTGGLFSESGPLDGPSQNIISRPVSSLESKAPRVDSIGIHSNSSSQFLKGLTRNSRLENGRMLNSPTELLF